MTTARSRRTLEPGEPREPLGPRRHVLALVLVGARHDESGEIALFDLSPERAQALGDPSSVVATSRLDRQVFAQRLELGPKLGCRVVRDKGGPQIGRNALGRRVDRAAERADLGNAERRSRAFEKLGEHRVSAEARLGSGSFHRPFARMPP